MSTSSMQPIRKKSKVKPLNISYMEYFSLNFCFVCLIVKSIVIAASFLNKVFGSCVLL